MVDEARAALSKGSKAVLMVSPPGSGKSVMIAEIAKSAADKGGHVLFLVHRKELVEQITDTFRAAEIPEANFTAMTVGKVKRRYDSIPWPTLIITDESHHARAKTYLDIYKHYQDVPRLGFTATPWRLSGDGFDDIYTDMVTGPSTKWLIDHHFLAPFKYWGADTIDHDKLKRSSSGDYTGQSMDDAFGKFIFADTVDQYRQHADGRQAIVYAYSIEFSKRVAAEFSAAGIPAAHADAQTPTRQREQIMADFKSGKLKILCNVDLISEGFNVPDCGVVILLRPTKSLVVFLQQSMRGMRYKPGKEAVILDQVANYAEHGLPDEDREWTLGARKRKNDTDDDRPINTCSFCLAVFREWNDMWGHKITNPHSKLKKYCPQCGEPKPAEERKETEDKEHVDGNLIDLTTEQGRLIVLAKRNPYSTDLKTAYQIVDAQIKTGQRKSKNAIYSVMFMMLHKGKKLTEHNVGQLEAVSGLSEQRIRGAYDWAKQKYQPREDDVQNVFNF